MGEQIGTGPQKLSADEWALLQQHGLEPKISRRPQAQPYVDDPASLAELLRRHSPQQQMRQQPQAQSFETQSHNGRKTNNERHRRTSPESSRRRPGRVTMIAIGSVAVLGVAGYATYNATDGFRHGLSFLTASSDMGNGVNIEALSNQGLSSLEQTRCFMPEQVLMSVTVEGSASIVPVLPGASQEPYMTDEAQAQLLSTAEAADATPDALSAIEDSIDDVSAYNTPDGYNHVTLNALPLYLTACAISPDAVVVNADGTYTINKAGIAMSFQDPNQLFTNDDGSVRSDLILTVPQIDDPIVSTDREAGQYMTRPLSMYVGQQEGNDAYNTAVAALNASMADPQQLAVMLATMEASVVQQLDRETTDDGNISYPGGTSDLEGAMDAALLTHLGINASKVTWTGLGTGYQVTANVAKVPGSTQAITEAVPLTNMRLLPFSIENVDIQYGAPTEPKPYEPPTPPPTPTETPAPTTGP